MKAIGYDTYTAASGLQLVDVDVPKPGASEVLVRVDAAALNAFDWHMYGGAPRVMRLQAGLKVKERRFVGADFVGTVEAIGSDVTSVAVGDRVLAETGGGGCAEYAVASVDAVARIADAVTSESAAASVMGALTSLQALRDSAKIQPGESVLVWGASGGVGHLGVQVARALGVGRVDAVCSSRNLEMVASTGADEVFAYDGDGVPRRSTLRHHPRHRVHAEGAVHQTAPERRRALDPRGCSWRRLATRSAHPVHRAHDRCEIHGRECEHGDGENRARGFGNHRGLARGRHAQAGDRSRLCPRRHRGCVRRTRARSRCGQTRHNCALAANARKAAAAPWSAAAGATASATAFTASGACPMATAQPAHSSMGMSLR